MSPYLGTSQQAPPLLADLAPKLTAEQAAWQQPCLSAGLLNTVRFIAAAMSIAGTAIYILRHVGA